MNVRTSAADATPPNGVLYGWLLLALFIEYARPTNHYPWLEFPYFYSAIPLSLLVVSSVAPGVRPMKLIITDGVVKWVFIFLALVALSVPFAPITSYATGVFTDVLGYVFLFVLISRIVRTEGQVRGVIVVLVLAHLYLLWKNPDALTDPQTRHYIVGGTFLGDGNDYALSLCILFPLVIEIALSSRKAWRRILMWGVVAIIVMAIVATQSRGGTIGVAAILFYLWLRSSKKLKSLVGIGMIGVLILIYAPPQYFQRMNTVGIGQVDGSAQGRIDAWKGAIGMAANNPVLGIGAGHFGARWGKNAHSSFMLPLAELGLPGFVAFLVLVLGNMRANALLRRQVLNRAGKDPDVNTLRIARMLDLMIAATLGFATAGAFLSATYYPHIYVLSGLLVSGRIIAARHAGLQLHSKRPRARVAQDIGPDGLSAEDQLRQTGPRARAQPGNKPRLIARRNGS